MNELARSLGRMLELDLERIEMKQKDLVAKLTDEGEPSLSEQGLSNWKRSGTIPRRRLDKMLEILGPESLIAAAYREGRFIPGKSAATMQLVGPNTPEPRGTAEHFEYRTNLVTARTANPGRSVNQLRESVRKFNGIRMSVVEDEVLEFMPEELKANFGNEMYFGAMALRIDYISPNVVIEIGRASSNAMNPQVYRPLWRLALARKVANDDRIYGLLMVLPAADERDDEQLQRNERYNRRLMLEAELMGLRLRFADDAKEAAKIIQMWEKPPRAEEEDDF